MTLCVESVNHLWALCSVVRHLGKEAKRGQSFEQVILNSFAPCWYWPLVEGSTAGCQASDPSGLSHYWILEFPPASGRPAFKDLCVCVCIYVCECVCVLVLHSTITLPEALQSVVSLPWPQPDTTSIGTFLWAVFHFLFSLFF